MLTTLRADIVSTATVRIDARDPASIIEALTSLVGTLAPAHHPAAIGVALGGDVKDFTLVRRAPFLDWHDINLGRLFTQHCGLPVVVSNDLDALTEAEHWFGAGRGVQSFAQLTIGTAVGSGLVIHDRLVTGPDSGIGPLGHFPLDPLGPQCALGHRGCADVMLSTSSILAQATILLGRYVTYEEVLDLAASGDPLASKIVGRSAYAFGTLIAAIANIAQPQRILLSGEGIRLARVGHDYLWAGIAQSRQPDASALDVRILEDDPQRWARGASAVAIQRTVLAKLPRL